MRHFKHLHDSLAERVGRHTQKHVVKVMRFTIALYHIARLKRRHMACLTASIRTHLIRLQPTHPLAAKGAIW